MCRTYAQTRWFTNDAELRTRSIRRAQCSDDTLCRGFLIRRENEPKYAVNALTSGFTNAVSAQAAPLFMSVVPRPCMRSPSMRALQGSSMPAGGTTSTCPESMSSGTPVLPRPVRASSTGLGASGKRMRMSASTPVDSIRSRAVSSTCRQAGDPETLGTRTSACVQRTARCSNVSCSMKMSFKEWLCVPWRIARSPELSGQDNRSSPASKIK